ncbi:hypothetical protein C0991_004308 [Blastosporella zonata]|nr:hypothetical protein C0991_004308 [Blastosporella zonata]
MTEMPAFRNLKARQSGRMWNKVPIAYDNIAENSWEIPNYSEISFTTPSYSEMPSAHSMGTSPSITSFVFDFEAYSVRESKGKSEATSSDADHIPRPKNAFILFRSHFYQTLGGSDQSQLSVLAGKAWRELSVGEKAPFQLMAKREKLEHQTKFPNYTYAPGPRTGSAKRKNSASKKKTTEPSTKKSLVPPLPRPSNVQLPFPIALSLSYPSTIATEVTESAPGPPDDDTPRSQSGLTANWSFPTAFVPTSEIPPLKLPPAKPELGTYSKDANFIRPPSFDTSNDPSGSSLKPPLIPELHYDNDGFKCLQDASHSFSLDASPLELDTWRMEDPSLAVGPLKISYGGYALPSDAAGVYSALDMGMDHETSNIGYEQDDLLSQLLTTHFTAHTPTYPFGAAVDCEMDQYVDYNGCDV